MSRYESRIRLAVLALLLGIAANESIATGRAWDVDDLFDLEGRERARVATGLPRIPW
jgi:hypothetical protein